MTMTPARWIDVGSVATLVAMGLAVALVGVRQLGEARADRDERHAEASDIDRSTEAMRREINELERDMKAMQAEIETLRGGADTPIPAGDQTTWLVGVADEIGLRLDRLTPARISGADSDSRLSLVVQGVGKASSVAALLARLRVERPAVELRSFSLQAEPRDEEADPRRVTFETRIEWRETNAQERRP